MVHHSDRNTLLNHQSLMLRTLDLWTLDFQAEFQEVGTETKPSQYIPVSQTLHQ